MKPVDEVQPPQAQTADPPSFNGARSARTLWGSLSWWPTLAGIGLASFITLDTSSGSELAPILATFDATWVFLGLAALFVGYGLLHGAAHPIDGLPLQAIAMVGFGTVAAIALIVSGDVGAYLVAAGLLGHAAWDVYHHWVDKVVIRSMAEFCCVLDTLLAVAIVVAAVRG